MAIIDTRGEFKNYCMRRLGYPVIQINVSNDQIEDRIDDAFDFFNEFHMDSTARFFHKHCITPEDISNQYLTIPNEITHIRRILPLNGNSELGGGAGSGSTWDPMYQEALSNSISFSHVGSSMQFFYQSRELNKTIQMIINGAQEEIDFNRYDHKLKIRVDWSKDIFEGQWIIIDAERLLLDPDDEDYNTVSDVYNDQWLKAYATALIKKQWADNMSKFSGITMPGGVTYNSEQLLSEAKEEIAKLQEEGRNIFQEPLGIFTG